MNVSRMLLAGMTVAVTANTQVVAPAALTPEQIEAAKRRISTHPAVLQDESVAQLYFEYLDNAKVLTSALRLKPDAGAKFHCDIFEVGTGVYRDSSLEFETAEKGGGRNLTLRSVEAGQDVTKTFTLLNAPTGLRGTSRSPSLKRPVVAANLFSRDLSSTSMNNGDPTFDFSGATYMSPVNSVTIVRTDTLGVVQNADNPQEFFIELGYKSTVVMVDAQEAALITGEYAIRYYREYRLVRGRQFPVEATFTLGRLKELFLPQFQGGKDLPESFMFQEWAPLGLARNGDFYRTNAIGICRETEAGSKAAVAEVTK